MRKLGFLERNLTFIILVAMFLGIVSNVLFPNFTETLGEMTVGNISIPLMICLISMLYPPFVKVDFKKAKSVFAHKKLLGFSLFQNFVFGPLLMFFIAIQFIDIYPEIFIGLILIGIARCIAMVIVWYKLAGGDENYTAGLVAINSLFQIITYSLYATLFIIVIPNLLGVDISSFSVETALVLKSVLIYLGVPLLLGVVTRTLVVKFKGTDFLEQKVIPTISPITLIMLVLTVFLLFVINGSAIISQPEYIILAGIPLILYFIISFFTSFFFAKKIGGTRE